MTPLNLDLIGQPERATQKRVIKLFQTELGYEFLGDWHFRDGNSNIEEGLLTAFLTQSGYSSEQISSALLQLRAQANNFSRSLYGNNAAVYSLLRYGVPVKVEAGKPTETVHLVNWHQPEKNHFAIAEEVTLHGENTRRPDIVIYLNGLAIGVLELKSSRASLGDGIRQSISNQQPLFHEWFYSTVQILFAGNDSQGLRYGTIGTPEKAWMTWKEDEADNSRFKLDKYLLKMCEKTRLIELLRDFVLFDAGQKKLPRVHQYFGLKAAQKHIEERKSGIIWHTQGSGKSLVMVLLAQWILENYPGARVAIVTDRDELDKQIKGVFEGVGESIHRTKSGRDLMEKLAQPTPRLLCSLVHKFGRRDVENFENFIAELESAPSEVVGDLFVFVDECHRTQSGKLNRVMKAMLPGATFIGFTGTPLLKKDKQTSLEVFGGYIHTYKFREAVEDEVVLDLVYEARDIDQRLESPEMVDQLFDVKTKALNEWQKAALRERFGTMQHVLSSQSRMGRVVRDIEFDFAVKPRLSESRGNAILVASSIYEACKYFTLFQGTSFKGKCAVVTSYNPQASDVSLEDTGANTSTDREFLFETYSKILEDVTPAPGKTKTETYEDEAKRLFKTEPATMKLLIVVNKLLTGFDAPHCTYLYIDKSMEDHGLFQAICRTNRLDGEDKPFGYIVDYKDLFKKVESAIAVYSSELDDESQSSAQILLQDRLAKGRQNLDDAIEALTLICEGVAAPGAELDYIHFFCGNTEVPADLKEREPARVAFYKAVAALVRCYAAIADELSGAGYDAADIARIEGTVNRAIKLREIVRAAAGETLDVKAFEADMRHLIDTFVQADAPRVISPFQGLSLLEIIAKTGIEKALDTLPEGLKSNQGAVAETIANNVRSKIIKDHLSDPAFYDKMSQQLDELIAARHSKAIEYEEYLKAIAALVKKLEDGVADDAPASIDTPGRRALYNNLGNNTETALALDGAIRRAKPDDWRGLTARENIVKAAMFGVVGSEAEVERLFSIVFEQKEY